MENSYNARATLRVKGSDYRIWRIQALKDRFDITRLPYTHKILLENLLRFEDGASVTREDRWRKP